MAQQQQQQSNTGYMVAGIIGVAATLLIVAALYTGFGGKSIKFLNLAA